MKTFFARANAVPVMCMIHLWGKFSKQLLPRGPDNLLHGDGTLETVDYGPLMRLLVNSYMEALVKLGLQWDSWEDR